MEWIHKIFKEQLPWSCIYPLFMLVLISADSRAQPLDTLLSWSYLHNPDLQALQLRYQAALERRNLVNQLPEPVFSTGVPILRPETRLGAQVATFGVTQMFPWKGTLDAKEQMSVLESRSKAEQINAQRLQISHAIREAYFRLQLLQAKQSILTAFVTNYLTLKDITLTRVETGRANTADVLRIDLKVNEINNQIDLLENRKSQFNAVINELTDQPPENTIEVEDLPDQPAAITYDLVQFRSTIGQDHPLIQQLDAEIEVARQDQILTELASKPSFGVGLDYSIVQARSDAEPSYNGRDIFIPKASVTIPIFQSQFRSRDQIAILQQEAASIEKQGLENQMISEIQDHKTNYDEALLLYTFAIDQTETLQTVYDLTLSEYSANQADFDELIDLLNQQLSLKIMQIESIAMTLIRRSAIEKLTEYQ